MSTPQMKKGKLTAGLVMLATFAVILGVIFMPVFDGKNGLEFMDNLYNSISKGSAYYIPAVIKENQSMMGNNVNLTLRELSSDQLEQGQKLLTAAGATVSQVAEEWQGENMQVLKVQGDIGKIGQAILEDSDSMFKNDGEALARKYGIDGKIALYYWYQVSKAMIRNLNRQELFPQAKTMTNIQTKALECSYNYYGIQAQSIGDGWVLVVFSLVFYVAYTVWYGWGILWVFEGIGLDLSGGH